MAQPDLENMTKEELLRLAEKNRIPVRRSLLKKEIVSALKRGLKKSAKASTRKTRVPPKTGKPPARVKATSRKARPAASGKKTAASKAKPRKSAEPKKVP
ncbi:MAG: hypothetical protein GWM98_25395, partial [Nitrospinaceae bacterium]|nr:hypothetical protein [Nitrospinaceae bacterium]NIS87642.1 hypothetical protein [Nitrospinaceae bacterium]NIT84509.1 hypothetical protein [Nitrospinaceae bacterium]NIU46699.1 hypothetical protein [Nitrospinaceae bacterium]NIU98893.1 hypothetical protein [Nitrospinaceae bacterium]